MFFGKFSLVYQFAIERNGTFFPELKNLKCPKLSIESLMAGTKPVVAEELELVNQDGLYVCMFRQTRTMYPLNRT